MLPTRSSASDLEALSALNARFIHNFVTHDVAGHDAILHPLFVSVTAYGRHDRSAYLAMWPAAFDAAETPYFDHRDEQITICGDVALVRAANKRTFRAALGRPAVITTYTDTYLRGDDGRWLCIEAHVTPLLAGHEPSDATILRIYLDGVLQAPELRAPEPQAPERSAVGA